jgi:hypothetical protein
VPSLTLSVCPDRADPLIAGGAVFTGGLAATIADVGAVRAVAVPALLLAVTATRSVEPISEEAIVWVWPVAPETSAQAPPELSQRRHWKPNVIGASPLQLPLDTVSVLPATAEPLIAGAALFVGGSACVAALPGVASASRPASDAPAITPKASWTLRRSRLVSLMSSLSGWK